MIKLTLDISEILNVVFKLPNRPKIDNIFGDKKEIYDYLSTIIPPQIDFSPIELDYLDIGGLNSDDFLHNLRFHHELYQESLEMYRRTGHTDSNHFYVNENNYKKIETKINNIHYAIEQMVKYCEQLTKFNIKLSEFENSEKKNKFDIYASPAVKERWYRFIVAYHNASLIRTGLDSNLLNSLQQDLINQIRLELLAS